MSLYPETEPKHTDYWIKNTVIKIIGDILFNDSSVIFYICDIEDEREDKRHKVFEHWYQKAANTYAYIDKYDYCIDSANGYRLNSSLLYNTDNFLRAYIIGEFKKSFGCFVNFNCENRFLHDKRSTISLVKFSQHNTS